MGVRYLLITSQCPGRPHTDKDLAPGLGGETWGFRGLRLWGVGVGARSSNVVGTFLCIDVLLKEGS